MKITKIVLGFLALIGFSLTSLFIFNSKPVSAAAPICYSAPSSSLGSPFNEVPATLADCNGTFRFLWEIEYGSVKDDFCYIVYETPIGQTGFTIPNTAEFAFGTTQCDTLANKTANTLENTAICKLFDATGGKPTYISGNWSINQLSDTDCAALEDKANESNSFTGFRNNWCYLFDSVDKTYITQLGCGVLATHAISILTDPSDNVGFRPITEDKRKELNECPGPGETIEDCLNKNPIVNLIKNAINFFSAGVGIVVVGVIILAGIQYSTAGANPNSTAAAKGRIVNAVVALLMYILLFAFIQWLIPGGIFS